MQTPAKSDSEYTCGKKAVRIHAQRRVYRRIGCERWQYLLAEGGTTQVGPYHHGFGTDKATMGPSLPIRVRLHITINTRSRSRTYFFLLFSSFFFRLAASFSSFSSPSLLSWRLFLFLVDLRIFLLLCRTPKLRKGSNEWSNIDQGHKRQKIEDGPTTSKRKRLESLPDQEYPRQYSRSMGCHTQFCNEPSVTTNENS